MLLARRCPAWRRREPDLRLLRGVWEGMPGHHRPRLFLRWLVVGRVSERMNREKDGVALPGMLADRLVVAVKLLSWGWSEGVGSILWIAGRSTRRLWEESDERATRRSPSRKPFDIPKAGGMGAYLRVKANKGAPGVDGCSLEEFEAGLRGNLYKIWNRMLAGSLLPFRRWGLVGIPEPTGGVRVLAVPTVAEPVAPTVVAKEAGGKGRADPPGVLRLPLWAARLWTRPHIVSEALLAAGLGGGGRYREVLRRRRPPVGAQGCGQARRRAVGEAVCGAAG